MKLNLTRFISLPAISGLTAALVCLALATVVIAHSPDNEKARSRAQKALRAGDFERAEQLYRDLLAKDDHDNEARLGLSHALLKLRRLQDSFDHAARVVAINPLSARAHALLGSAVLASGDFRLSVEEFRTALVLDTNEAMALAGLAAARSERYKEAADAYERFLVIAPRTDAERRARISGLIDFLRYLGSQGSLYDLQGSDRTVVDFEAPDFRPIVKLRINGSKEYLRFVLDTGSGMSVLSEETAKKMNVKSVARGGMARAVGGGGRFEIVYGYLDSIDIGDFRVTNVPVYIRHFFDEQVAVDGYLGIAALSRLVASVDYGRNQLTLARPRSNDAETSSTRPQTSAVSEISQRPGVNIPVRTTASGFLSGEVSID